jgi:hypothetical protein
MLATDDSVVDYDIALAWRPADHNIFLADFDRSTDRTFAYDHSHDGHA